MKIIKEIEETVTNEETGESISYTTRYYDNGTTERFPTDSPPRIVTPPVLTEDQELAHNAALNIELLLAMQLLEGGI